MKTRKNLSLSEKQQKYLRELGAVTTLNEASRIFGIPRATIELWIIEDKVTASKVGRTWLISLGSLRDFAGLPRHIQALDSEVSGLLDRLHETIN